MEETNTYYSSQGCKFDIIPIFPNTVSLTVLLVPQTTHWWWWWPSERRSRNRKIDRDDGLPIGHETLQWTTVWISKKTWRKRLKIAWRQCLNQLNTVFKVCEHLSLYVNPERNFTVTQRTEWGVDRHIKCNLVIRVKIVFETDCDTSHLVENGTLTTKTYSVDRNWG